MSHWVEAYVGRPWVAGDSDCWNLARCVWREHFGRDVPAVVVDPSSALAGHRAFRDGDFSRWIAVQSPQEGDAVLMARGDSPCHVGIWVGIGAVLHSIEGAGVVCTPARRVPDIGYRVTGFYRWAADVRSEA